MHSAAQGAAVTSDDEAYAEEGAAASERTRAGARRGTRAAEDARAGRAQRRAQASGVALLLLSLMLFTNCATTGLKPWPPPQPSDAPVVFILFRSQCHGVCPSYRLSIRADGLLEYEGLFSVEEMGRRWSRVTSEQVSALTSLEFQDNRPKRSLSWLLEEGCATGRPTVTIVSGSETDGRVFCSPEEMAVRLEERALRILNGLSWVKLSAREP